MKKEELYEGYRFPGTILTFIKLEKINKRLKCKVKCDCGNECYMDVYKLLKGQSSYCNKCYHIHTSKKRR